MASVEDFKSYVAWRLEEKGLFERKFIQSLQQNFAQLSLESQSEPTYLASFASLAGGWQTDVGRTLINDIGVQSIDDLKTVDLVPLTESAEYHPHRHRNYQDVDEAVASLNSLTYDSTQVSSITEFITKLHEMKQHSGSSVAFDRAMTGLQRLDSFGRIAAFDYLEVLTRAHGHDWIAPDQLRLSHIETSKPKETFEEIYDTSINDPGAQRHLDELQRWAQLEQGMNRIESVFDIESCLCTFDSDSKDANASQSGCISNGSLVDGC